MSRKISLLIALMLTVSGSVLAQNPTISSLNMPSVTNRVYLQGLDMVDELTVDFSDPNTSNVLFTVYDSADQPIQAPFSGIIDNGTAYFSFNTGALDTAARYVIADFFDSQGNLLEYSDPYEFTVKPLPSWASGNSTLFQNGVITALSPPKPDGSIDVKYEFPIYRQLFTVPNDVVGLGGRSFGISKNDFVFDGIYNVDGGLGDLNDDTRAYQFQINAFDYFTYPDTPYRFALDTIISPLEFSLDNDLELTAEYQYTKTIEPILKFKSKEWKYRIPAAPFLKIGVSVGFQLDGGIKLRALYGRGQQTGKWGFIGDLNSDSVSSISVGGKATGSVIGSISLISKKLASVEGKLDLIGQLGASYRFVTADTLMSNFTWGGDLQLTGSLRITGLGQDVACAWVKFRGGECGPNGEIWEGRLWPDTGIFLINGGMPSNFPFMVAQSHDSYSRSETYAGDWVYDGLDDLTQQSFSTKGNKVGVVWIEEDSTQHLFFSELDNGTNSFRDALALNDTNFSVSSPKVALMSDGSAIIVWSQNKFAASDIDSTMDPENYFDAQDTWYAIYDKQQDTIMYTGKINQSQDLPEGMPSVTINDSSSAIITWLAEDPDYGYIDVWHSELSKVGNQWYQSTPDILTYDYPGSNSSVSVSYLDNDNALAFWIYDEDQDDSTSANQILLARYNSVAGWSDPETLSAPNDTTKFGEITTSFNGGYGAIAYTFTENDEFGNFVGSGLYVNIYDVNNNSWSSQKLNLFDSLSEYKMPSVSISDQGLLALSYKKMDLFVDSGEVSLGTVQLVTKDLNTNTNNDWVDISNNQYVCGQDVFSWKMDVAFGQDNTLYTLSHESDTIAGPNYLPDYGRLFGDPSMGLVLRGLQISSGSDEVDTVAILPATPTGIGSVVLPSKELNLKVYPNPFSDKTTIDFFIPEFKSTSLKIYDLMGREITTLISQKLGQGSYRTNFEPIMIEKGFYILKLISGDYSITKRIVLE
jgi:hypothetical protein